MANISCFLRARDFKPTFGEEEFENIYRRHAAGLLVTFAKDTESPLGPRATKSGKAKRKTRRRTRPKDKKDDKKEKNAKKPVTVKVDLDGIHNRIVGLEIAPADYRDLRLVDGRVFYLRRT